jgi:L-ascorbate metabolism protein UlaG (beta-lactamase superfamily)
MKISRRDTMKLGLAGATGLGLSGLMSFGARAQDAAGDSYPTENGEITVHPIEHASFVMSAAGTVIYCDPVGGAAAYADLPPPDLILITHEHGDHFDLETLTALAGDGVPIVVNPAVHEKLPEELKSRAEAIANGESTEVGEIKIEAVPAYNMTEDRLQYHPKGRDNGYILTVDGRRVYIAGDTEDIPEMRALTDIYIAFVPMNLPYTMDVDQASSAVAEFKPENVYPYHYGDSDVEAFAAKVKEDAPETNVVLGAWYS